MKKDYSSKRNLGFLISLRYHFHYFQVIYYRNSNIVATMADHDDDDPVIDEIDVYLSKSLADNLYLMQYPLRPLNRGYGNFDHLSARIKPQQKRIEMSLGLDTYSKNYSRSKGEQIAVNVDGNAHTSSDRFFSSSKMDKIILSCPPYVKTFSNCQYAAGLLKDGELHLTPVSAVVQMRPSFDYLDKADTRHRSESSVATTDGGESSQDEAEEEATPVNMKVARGESEEFRARRMASYEYINQKREEERWIPIIYHTSESILSETERQQLLASDGPRVPQFKISTQEYLQALIPPSDEDISEKPAMPDNVLSLNELRKLDLADQIKALLINVKVIRFNQLISFLARGTDQQAVLRTLQSMAVLVQGCWVVKSELLYPDEEKEELARKRKSHNAVNPELLRRVRDYAMWKFTHNKYVVRKDISSIVQLRSDEVKEILEKMSRLKAKSGWEFLYDYDRDFCERHPEIVQRQRNKWALTFHTLAQHFKMPKDGDKKALELEMALMNQQPTDKHRTRRLSSRSPRKRTLSGRSLSDLSDMEVDNQGDKSYHHYEKHKTSDNSSLKNITDTLSCNGGVHSQKHVQNGFSPSHCDKFPSQMEVDGVTGKDNSRLMQELEKFVKEALAESATLCMSDLRSKLSMYTARVASAHVFSAGVSDSMFEEAVTSVGGFRLKNMWPPNRKPEPMYAMYSGNDATNHLKRILFSMFEEYSKIRSVQFKTKAKESGIDLSDADVRRFLKEHCDSISSLWYLKRTLPTNS
ncbi:DNA-directed RNA polymerase III subunit RPC5 [Biomphalaria glabrata]|nr:DNA-directed RNA polymerase III subunit RPC5-like; partial [Biomphalaria glabrata]